MHKLLQFRKCNKGFRILALCLSLCLCFGSAFFAVCVLKSDLSSNNETFPKMLAHNSFSLDAIVNNSTFNNLFFSENTINNLRSSTKLSMLYKMHYTVYGFLNIKVLFLMLIMILMILTNNKGIKSWLDISDGKK